MRGADVVASDLTPELFEPGRRRAAEQGVELEWVEADAEELPFETASFDAAISTFGIMFAPRQSVAAAELARVVQPGGRIALCSWAPAGFVSEMFATIASFLNPPPPPEGPPVRWGTEEGAHELLNDAFEIACEQRTLLQRYDGPVDEMTDYFMDRFGPMVMARRTLEPSCRPEGSAPPPRSSRVGRVHQHGARGRAGRPAGVLGRIPHDGHERSPARDEHRALSRWRRILGACVWADQPRRRPVVRELARRDGPRGRVDVAGLCGDATNRTAMASVRAACRWNNRGAVEPPASTRNTRLYAAIRHRLSHCMG